MFRTIQWQLFLRAKRPEKVAAHLEIVEKALGCPVELRRQQVFWKDRALFSVEFATPICETEPEHAVFRALHLASKVLREWTVVGPTEYGDGRWEFRGSGVDKHRGFELITFSTCNFDEERDTDSTIRLQKA